MTSLLLSMIYLSFISLGLPDSILGAAWPTMSPEFAAPVSAAGLVSFLISAGTIVSSMFSERLTKRFGAGLVTAFSVALTAASLFGFSLAPSFPVLCLLAVPYGLGAGAVDAALNNYVALHYASRHMSWLHCFWGVGASAGPYIMGVAIGAGRGWRVGYGSISVLQWVLAAMLFCSLPLWKNKKKKDAVMIAAEAEAATSLRTVLGIPGVKATLVAFFCYCAVETTTGLWASTYLVSVRGVNAVTAARFASLFYIGITAGRAVSGFVTDRVGDKNMIRIGIALMLAGLCAVLLPLPVPIALGGLVLVGLGCAPVYPAIIHATPVRFGASYSQAIVGVEMACAYLGSTVVAPLFGVFAELAGLSLYPCYLLLFSGVMLVMTERINAVMR